MAGLVRLRRCSGESRCRKVVCRCGKGWVSHPIREYGGEIFTDSYFGEANTANKSDNLHNNAINKNLNWGGFPGCYRGSSADSPREMLFSRKRLYLNHAGGASAAPPRETLFSLTRQHLKY